MATTTRMNITVPEELKARMDRVKVPVNWSATACQAFETKLAEIATQRRIESMSSVIERLRESDKEGHDETYRAGMTAGKNWAKREAKAGELRRLERSRAKVRDYEWDMLFDENSNNAYAPCEWVVFDIRPNTDGNREAADEFWENVLGVGYQAFISDEQFIKGFAEGALDVWADVKDQL